jgi:hypothetical protein
MGGSRRRNVPDQMEQPMMRNEHVVRAHQAPVQAINPFTSNPWRVIHVDTPATNAATGNGPDASPYTTLAQAQNAASAAYDIVYVFADVMRRAGITGDAPKLKAERVAIRDNLMATNLDGVVGKVCFSKDHDSELSAYIIRIKNGQRTLLDSHAPDRCM